MQNVGYSPDGSKQISQFRKITVLYHVALPNGGNITWIRDTIWMGHTKHSEEVMELIFSTLG